MNIQHHWRPLTIVLSLSFMLSACIGGGDTPAIRYYLLEPVETENALSADTSGLKLEVIDLQVPQYLERFHIATRRGENELEFSEFHQWGENLRKNLMRTLAGNLSRQLKTDNIATPLERTASIPDLRLQVYIERFDQGSDGRVSLEARWQLSSPGTEQAGEVQRFSSISQTINAPGDYVAMVAAMQAQYVQLCNAIAASIITTLEQGKK